MAVIYDVLQYMQLSELLFNHRDPDVRNHMWRRTEVYTRRRQLNHDRLAYSGRQETTASLGGVPGNVGISKGLRDHGYELNAFTYKTSQFDFAYRLYLGDPDAHAEAKRLHVLTWQTKEDGVIL